MSKCQIVGNLMPRLNFIYGAKTQSTSSIPVFLRIPIAICDFPGGWSLDPYVPAHVYDDVSHCLKRSAIVNEGIAVHSLYS